MHLEIFIRGDYWSVKRFFSELHAKYLDFHYMESDGKGGFKRGTRIAYKTQIGVRVAPLGIYEITFPEEHLDLVLNTVLKGGKGEPWKPWMKKYISMLRMLMKLHPIPDYDKTEAMPVFNEEIEIIAIGLKYDSKDELGNENI